MKTSPLLARESVNAVPFANRLARFALGINQTQISDARRLKVALIVADFLGCVFAGSTLPEASCAFVLASPGDVCVLGTDHRLSPESAVIAMATMGSLLQMHDGYGNGGNHPSSCIVSAVWCMRGDRSMDDLLMAVAVGYEVANRIAASAHPAMTLAGLAPTSCTGAIGAAAAIGRLLGCSEEVVSRAISNAAFSFPTAALRGLTEHGSVVPLHGGLAARCALESVRLAQAGLSAGTTVLEGGEDPGVFSLIRSRWQSLQPESWLCETLDAVYFKPIPACRHAQPAIDAIESIWREGPIHAGDIDRIDIHTYPVALRFGTIPDAAGELYDRLMSVTWAVASALRHGRFDIGNVLAPAIDPQVQHLCRLVRTHVDQNYAELYPSLLTARVEISLRDGSVRQGECRMAYGTPSELGPYSPMGTCIAPLDKLGVFDKFMGLVQTKLSHSEALAIWESIVA
jgi:2-methylcitrate dehydratase PrpD